MPTIRYYEEISLLVPGPRSDAGRRVYGDEAVRRLTFHPPLPRLWVYVFKALPLNPEVWLPVLAATWMLHRANQREAGVTQTLAGQSKRIQALLRTAADGMRVASAVTARCAAGLPRLARQAPSLKR